MKTLLLVTVLGLTSPPDLNRENRYFIHSNSENYTQGISGWIKDEQGRVVIEFAASYIYNNSLRIDSHDDGQRLKLVSKQGWTLDNIPLYHNRFYNECVEIFVENHTELPRVYQCLRSAGLNTVSYSGITFSFPDKPEIDSQTGLTYFKKYSLTCESCQSVYKNINFWGYNDYQGNIQVTLGDGSLSVSGHEYIHSCGYSHTCCRLDLEEKYFGCDKKKK